MAYGRGGKTWNLGYSDRGQDGVTDRQLRFLKSLTGGKDHRGLGLTVEKASALISKLYAEREKANEGLPDIADQLFTRIMKRAVEAANEAGGRWLADHANAEFAVNTPSGLLATHDQVGLAYITAPKKGSGLYKWIVGHGFDDRRNKKALYIPHRHTERMEAGLSLACCIAALDVLMDASGEVGDIRILLHVDDENYKLAA